MRMLQKKICMLGAYAVGKTSLVRRFVESIFDEKYHTTLGVKIDKCEVEIGDIHLTLVLWDLARRRDGTGEANPCAGRVRFHSGSGRLPEVNARSSLRSERASGGSVGADSRGIGSQQVRSPPGVGGKSGVRGGKICPSHAGVRHQREDGRG